MLRYCLQNQRFSHKYQCYDYNGFFSVAKMQKCLERYKSYMTGQLLLFSMQFVEMLVLLVGWLVVCMLLFFKFAHPKLQCKLLKLLQLVGCIGLICNVQTPSSSVHFLLMEKFHFPNFHGLSNKLLSASFNLLK